MSDDFLSGPVRDNLYLTMEDIEHIDRCEVESKVIDILDIDDAEKGSQMNIIEINNDIEQGLMIVSI